MPEAVENQDEPTFVRFHQRYLELLNIDVMYNLNNDGYFQGLNQILAPLYFMFIKTEFLQQNELLEQFSLTHRKDLLDYVSITEGIDEVVTDYDQLLQVALYYVKSSCQPLFTADMKQLTQFIQITFDPLLRYMDSRIYQRICSDENLLEIAPTILMGAMLSHMQYHSNQLDTQLQLLDIAIQGDHIFVAYLCTAFFVLSVRYCNKDMFTDDLTTLKMKPGCEEFTVHEEFADVMSRVMRSMDKGEKVLESFIPNVISFAQTAFVIQFISERIEGVRMNFVQDQLNVSKKVSKLPYEQKQSELLKLFVTPSEKPWKSWIHDIENFEYWLSVLSSSIEYCRVNNIKGTQLNFQKALNEFAGKTKEFAEIALKKTKQVALEGFKATQEFTILKTKQLQKNAKEGLKVTKEFGLKAFQQSKEGIKNMGTKINGLSSKMGSYFGKIMKTDVVENRLNQEVNNELVKEEVKEEFIKEIEQVKEADQKEEQSIDYQAMVDELREKKE